MTNTAQSLDNLHIVHIHKFSDALTGYRLELLQESYGEDGIFFPPQSIFIHGEGIRELRKLLNSLPE